MTYREALEHRNTKEKSKLYHGTPRIDVLLRPLFLSVGFGMFTVGRVQICHWKQAIPGSAIGFLMERTQAWPTATLSSRLRKKYGCSLVSSQTGCLSPHW